MLLKIEDAYYNAKEIRRLGRNNRDNLVITYTNGEIEHTDYQCSEPRFNMLVKEWEKCLNEKQE